MMIALLYDTDKRMLLGRGGKWVKPEDFQKSPPVKAEDLKPADPKPKHHPDPGPRYCCIDHELYICYGDTCFDLGVPC